MKLLSHPLGVVSGARSELESVGSASRLHLIIATSILAVACSAVYGLAVGATPAGFGFTNALKVPIVVVLSGLFALPPSILLLQIFGRPLDPTQLWLSQASGTLTASLVLASVAPMVGLFYYSSDGFGGVIAVVAGCLALVAGTYVFLRAVSQRVLSEKRAAAFVPVAALLILQGLAVLQLIALTSPILPEVTPFAQGVDMFGSLR